VIYFFVYLYFNPKKYCGSVIRFSFVGSIKIEKKN